MDIICFDEKLPTGTKYKVARIAKGLRQIDLAVMADQWLKLQEMPWKLYKIGMNDVVKLEAGRKLHWIKMKAFCHVLGITWEDATNG